MERLTALILIAGLTVTASSAAPTDRDLEERCIETSARYNRIPAALLEAIRLQEGGQIGQWHTNADGSIDYGVMQINSRWLPVLTAQGYTAQVLTYDACASIAAGAWILVHALADAGAWNRTEIDGPAYWRAVGNYHSHTPHLNRNYVEHVWIRYRQETTSGAVP